MKVNAEVYVKEHGSVNGKSSAVSLVRYHNREYSRMDHFRKVIEGKPYRAGLLALEAALESVKRDPSVMRVDVFHPNATVVNAVEEGWIEEWRANDRKRVVNRDVWMRIRELIRDMDITFNREGFTPLQVKTIRDVERIARRLEGM